MRLPCVYVLNQNEGRRRRRTRDCYFSVGSAPMSLAKQRTSSSTPDRGHLRSSEGMSVLPGTGSADGIDDVVDGSDRVRIKPIDTRLHLHFKQTQVGSGVRWMVPTYI